MLKIIILLLYYQKLFEIYLKTYIIIMVKRKLSNSDKEKISNKKFKLVNKNYHK